MQINYGLSKTSLSLSENFLMKSKEYDYVVVTTIKMPSKHCKLKLSLL